jgi:hypothetical protein
MTSKAKTVAGKAKPPRSKPSRALAVPATTIAVEHPAMQMVRDMHAMMSAMAAKIDAMEAKIDATAVVLPATMIDSATALTIVQACHVLNGMDDGRLYNRPHLIHRTAGICLVDNDEIRAAFPDDHNQARFLEIVERNKPRSGHRAYVENVQADEPQPALLSHLAGNDKTG